MNVKGGVAYIDFKYNDVSTNRTFVIEGIYSNFNKAYNSRKTPILTNMVFSGEKLCDMTTTGIRRKSNLDFVIAFQISPLASANITTRYITVSSNDSVTTSPNL